MNTLRANAIFRRMDAVEGSLCLLCNRAGQRHAVERLFVVVSRLGNGVFWYALMAVLPLVYGSVAVRASAHMGIVGFICMLLYKSLKRYTVRPRPYMTHSAIRLGTPPLDLYSFPSGHTLHAVAFTIVALHYYPGLDWLLVPFASLVALSRVVLGLHYPTDVLAGAAVGTLVAWVSLSF